MPPVRRLTAILAADVAGYSRLMGVDEEGTHERLQGHLREIGYATRDGVIPPLRERKFADSLLEGTGFEISVPRYHRWSRGCPRYAIRAQPRVASEFASTRCRGELGFDFRLTGFGSKASSLVCRLESLRIPAKHASARRALSR
jgi:hypothetical protein